VAVAVAVSEAAGVDVTDRAGESPTCNLPLSDRHTFSRKTFPPVLADVKSALASLPVVRNVSPL
jgi:hypothetical protein